MAPSVSDHVTETLEELVRERDQLAKEHTSGNKRRDIMRTATASGTALSAGLLWYVLADVSDLRDQVATHRELYQETSEVLHDLRDDVRTQNVLIQAQLQDCETRGKLMERNLETMERRLQRYEQDLSDATAHRRQSAIQAADGTQLAAVVRAIGQIGTPEQSPAAYTQDGKPRTEALQVLIGRPVGADERDRAWAVYRMAGGR